MTPQPPPRGPVYDDAMKILAADDLDAVLSLLGIPGPGARALNVELAGPLRVDLLAHTSIGLVHAEFVKDTDPHLDTRMVEYWARIRRREGRAPRQFVLALGDTVTAPDRCRDGNGREVLAWTVLRVADLDPTSLLANPTTAALAALAAGTPAQRAAVFAAAARHIATTGGRRRELQRATEILASIVLPRSTIDTILKGAGMPILIRDTPLGRELIEQGRAEGRQEGRAEGRQEGERGAVERLTRLLLSQRFGQDPALEAAVAALADLPDEERLARIAAADTLSELTG